MLKVTFIFFLHHFVELFSVNTWGMAMTYNDYVDCRFWNVQNQVKTNSPAKTSVSPRSSPLATFRAE